MNTLKAESLMSKGSFWFPELLFSSGVQTDRLFYFIFICSCLMFVGIIFVVFYFLKKYKKTQSNQVAELQLTHHHLLELSWTIIPLILVLFVFGWGFKGFLTLSVAPSDAMEIHVVAKKWLWQFEYPNGNKTIGELVVPVHKPIKLIMTSEDVIHSFYLPNFRVKRDVVPNRYTRLWFESKRVGNFQIFCTEFCGDGHSDMLGVLRVLDDKAYVAWEKEVNSGADMPLDQLGEKVYTTKGCITCHSIDGSVKTGPTWKGLFGSVHKLTNGQSVSVEENYIRESITAPQAKVVAGFQPVMPTYSGVLNDREIVAVIEYIKKLK